jgi:hypothetical protein
VGSLISLHGTTPSIVTAAFDSLPRTSGTMAKSRPSSRTACASTNVHDVGIPTAGPARLVTGRRLPPSTSSPNEIRRRSPRCRRAHSNYKNTTSTLTLAVRRDDSPPKIQRCRPCHREALIKLRGSTQAKSALAATLQINGSRLPCRVRCETRIGSSSSDPIKRPSVRLNWPLAFRLTNSLRRRGSQAATL